MTLKDLFGKVLSLEQRATDAFKAEVAELKAAVTAITDGLKAELTAALENVAALTKQNSNLTAEISALTAKLSEANEEALAFNESLTDACLNGKLFAELKGADGKPLAADAAPEVIRAAALNVSVQDKFKLYQGALNAAFARAGLPNNTLPTPPAASAALPAASANAKQMKMSEFRTLSPKGQSDFCALVREGRAQLIQD